MKGVHISREKAVNYGMPNIGARYRSDYIRSHTIVENEEGWTPCAICGRPAGSVHHLPPISASSAKDDNGEKHPGSLLLPTKYGRFVLKPALVALCGNGTMGCHGMIHSGKAFMQWEFDSEAYEELWFDGWFLSHGIDGYIETRDGHITCRPIAPHSSQLYRIGRWKITVNGRTWEYRGSV